jgi:hypothetical protein
METFRAVREKLMGQLEIGNIGEEVRNGYLISQVVVLNRKPIAEHFIVYSEFPKELRGKSALDVLNAEQELYGKILGPKLAGKVKIELTTPGQIRDLIKLKRVLQIKHKLEPDELIYKVSHPIDTSHPSFSGLTKRVLEIDSTLKEAALLEKQMKRALVKHGRATRKLAFLARQKSIALTSAILNRTYRLAKKP